MSWNKLAPIVKSTGRPMASASIVVNKDGPAKISLILSGSLKDEFDGRAKADVFAGSDEHEGCLLVTFDPAGEFDVKNFVHGGARIFLPIAAGLPDKPAANQPCIVRDKTADGFVVELPIAAWRADIADRIGPPKRPAASVAATAPVAATPPPAGNGQPLDAVEYLKGKGRMVARLAAGRFQVDGETWQLGQVLKLVNDLRAAADLDPLPAGKIW